MSEEPRDRAWRAITVTPADGFAAVADRPDAWSGWAAGVLLIAAGDYRGGFARLEPLVTGPEPEVAGLAAAARASGLRQLGEHAGAEPWDERAAGAPGAARCDGHIGLAADRVGRGDPAGARQRLARALPELTDWRDRVRYGWVACECDLLQDDPAAGAAAASTSLYLARQAGSVRHVAKSLLFLGVCRETERPGAGGPDLLAAAELAQRHDLRPLLWPAVVVLAERAPPDLISGARAAVAFSADRLPPDAGSNWDGPQAVAALPA